MRWIIAVVVAAAACGGAEPESKTPDAGASAIDAATDLQRGADIAVDAGPHLAEGWEVDDYFRSSELGEVPEYAQRDGNVDRGYDILVNEGYVSCGIPARIYDRLLAGDVPDWAKLPGRRDGNEDLPFNQTRFERDGIELVSTNCLQCHANTLPDGRLMVGLGNDGDFTTDLGRFIELGRGLVDAENAREVFEYDRFLERSTTVAPYIKTDTIGVNPADTLASVLTAHRDPDTWEWLDEPWFDISDVKPIPLSVPPWWHTQKKNALYYTAIGRGDHARFMMAAALLCTDSEQEAREIDELFVHVREYIESVDPPSYQFSIDGDLADRGKTVFEETCSRCHGTYSANPGDETYPNLVIGLDEVGTDPVLAEEGALSGKESVAWLNRSFFGEVSIVAPSPGYVAPPLDGIWATAPYLHNASVPTLRGVIDPDARPAAWSRTGGYDRDDVGLAFQEHPGGKESAADADEAKAIYDTSLWGYGNQGHTFGAELADEDVDAVIEYLKRL